MRMKTPVNTGMRLMLSTDDRFNEKVRSFLGSIGSDND